MPWSETLYALMKQPFPQLSASSSSSQKILVWSFVLVLVLMFSSAIKAQDFKSVKFGDDFLSIGGGARALAMGSAHAALVNDVTAAYWNVAALSRVENVEAMYMHSERFSGVVGYDYGAVAVPVNPDKRSVVAVTFIRQGVDGIKNTLNAWNVDRDLPKSDPANYITEFSYSDLAFLLSYSSSTTQYFSWGVNAKILNSRMGPFANAWGYSLDLGVLYKGEFADWGIQLVNIPSLMKFWSVNAGNLQPLAEIFEDEVPSGQNEKSPMSVKVGLSKVIPMNKFSLALAMDSDIYFDGRETYYLNLGSISFEPHAGAELSFNNLVSLRAGVTDVVKDFSSGYTVTPTLGAGLHFKSVSVDYGIDSFSGVSSELGTTHRVSLKVGF